MIRWTDECFVTPYDLRSSCFCFVKFSGSQVVVCDTSGEQPLGILQNHPESGEIAVVRVNGRSNIQGAGGAQCGAFVKTNHSGLALSVVAGDYSVAWCQEKLSAGTQRRVMVCTPRQI